MSKQLPKTVLPDSDQHLYQLLKENWYNGNWKDAPALRGVPLALLVAVATSSLLFVFTVRLV